MRLNKLELAIGIICVIVGCVAWYRATDWMMDASDLAFVICGIGFIGVGVRG